MNVKGNRGLKYRTIRVDLIDENEKNTDWKHLVNETLPSIIKGTDIFSIPTFYDSKCYTHENFLDICNSMNFCKYAIRADVNIADINFKRNLRYWPHHLIIEAEVGEIEKCIDLFEETKCIIYFALKPDLDNLQDTRRFIDYFRKRKYENSFPGNIYLSIPDIYDDRLEQLKDLITHRQKINFIDNIENIEKDRIDLIREDFKAEFKGFICNICKYFIRVNVDNELVRCPQSKTDSRKALEENVIRGKDIVCHNGLCGLYLLEYGFKKQISGKFNFKFKDRFII